MGRVIVLDTETTGFSTTNDRVIEVAVVDFHTGEVLMHTRLDPEQPIPEDSTRVHGITDEMVRGCPRFVDVAGALALLINEAEAVGGYNPFYDRGMING